MHSTSAMVPSHTMVPLRILHFTYAATAVSRFAQLLFWQIIVWGPMEHPAFFGLSASTRDLLWNLIGFQPHHNWSTDPSRDVDAYEIFCGRAHLSQALADVPRQLNGTILASSRAWCHWIELF